MKLNKSKLLAFAKLIKCVQEVNTNNGVLISEGEIVVGSEVFIADENGDLVPATDGVYETENVIYTIESGIVKAIEEKADPIEEPVEEPTEPVVEENAAEDPIEEPVEEPTATDERDAEIEDLNAQIETLNQRIAELEAENEELKKKLAEPVEDPIEEQTTLMSKEDKRKAKLNAIAEAFNRK